MFDLFRAGDGTYDYWSTYDRWEDGSVLPDREAQRVLAGLFPGREIVAIHSENINRSGGGMNGITQQQPASAAARGAQ